MRLVSSFRRSEAPSHTASKTATKAPACKDGRKAFIILSPSSRVMPLSRQNFARPSVISQRSPKAFLLAIARRRTDSARFLRSATIARSTGSYFAIQSLKRRISASSVLPAPKPRISLAVGSSARPDAALPALASTASTEFAFAAMRTSAAQPLPLHRLTDDTTAGAENCVLLRFPQSFSLFAILCLPSRDYGARLTAANRASPKNR